MEFSLLGLPQSLTGLPLAVCVKEESQDRSLRGRIGVHNAPVYKRELKTSSDSTSMAIIDEYC